MDFRYCVASGTCSRDGYLKCLVCGKDWPQGCLTPQCLSEKDFFETGSVRDTQNGKPRYDLMSVVALERIANHYALGAKKYGDRNWEKGQPFSRVYASLLRHIYAFAAGKKDEDHLAAVAWNAMALMHFEKTHPELDDMPKLQEK